MIDQLFSTIKEEYYKSFEFQCLEVTIEGYRDLCKTNFDIAWHETDFSSALVRAMNKLEIAQQFKIDVSTEYPLISEISSKGDAKKQPRIDIRMLQWNEVKVEFMIEAKNLSENNWQKNGLVSSVNAKKLHKEYIKEGVSRYISEKYPFGCMLGYVQQGNIKNIISGINIHCDGDVIGKIANQETLFNYTHIYYSDNRIGNEVKQLRHIFLDFTI